MAHENLQRDQAVEGSSDRSFGLVFSIVLTVVAAWPLLDREAPRWWALALAVVLALIAVLWPALLSAPNRWWLKLGIALGNIVGPIALGILFYGVMAPLGFVMRLTGKDPLRTRLDSGADSYWVPRKPPGPPPDSLTNQF
jgi:hypothetical protein